MEKIKQMAGYAAEETGLQTYEYIANHIDAIEDELPSLIDKLITCDRTGQFVVSTARYLHAIDAKHYAKWIDQLVAAAITKDRERVYLGDLAAALWGADYRDHATELCASDDNFRRVYKRLYPVGLI